MKELIFSSRKNASREKKLNDYSIQNGYKMHSRIIKTEPNTVKYSQDNQKIMIVEASNQFKKKLDYFGKDKSKENHP